MSAEDARPWWASPDPEVDRLDPDEDPVAAVRAARHAPDGEPDGEREPAPGPDPDPDPDLGHDGRRAGAETGGQQTEACDVCPICLGWRYVRDHHPDVAEHLSAAGRHLADAQPEVAEHLAAAGRHLTAALRHLVDERAEHAADGERDAEEGTGSAGADRAGRGSAPGRTVFERIVLDDEEDEG